MRAALHRHSKPTPAIAPAHIAPMAPLPALQPARPAPMHDISGVAIGDVAQRKAATGGNADAYRAPNRTGLPDRLKAAVEARSGLSLDRVRVHTNSSQPAQLNAHAYTRGSDIHVAPGQERHLAHEAWHVVQQAQGRVRPTISVAGESVNDDAGLEREADRFQSDMSSGGSYSPPAVNDAPLAQPTSGVVQRKVKVGGDTYEPGKRGFTPDKLVEHADAEADAKSLTMRKGWKGELRTLARDTVNTTTYTDWDEVLDTFKSDKGAKKRARLEEQDNTIKALLASKTVKEPARKRARIIAYESEKALDSVRKYIKTTTEYDDTKKELKALAAEEMDTTKTTEVSKTESSAFVFEALEDLSKTKDMKRMDINFHSAPIITHGFETGDRTKDASTLNPFGFGPIKIGKDVGSYRKILKANKKPKTPENKALTTLEMLRVPKSSAMTGLKRDLLEQGKTGVSEAMAIDKPTSNVEFVGAVSGSGISGDAYERMQQQQILSNAMILDDAVTNFPTFEIGAPTKDKKARTTPQEISDTLNEFVAVMKKKKPTKQELREAKKKMRRKLRRSIASVQEIEGYDSSGDVSDYEGKHYD